MTKAPCSYIICTSPRSGSTLLCHLLSNTGKSGAPNSHFHEPSLSAWGAYYDIPRNLAADRLRRSAIFAAALKKGRGRTDCFGMRIQQESFEFFLKQLRLHVPNAPTDNARIRSVFGPTLYIHLTRQTKLDQVISLEIALQSGLWHKHGDGSELERVAPHRAPTYDSAALISHLQAYRAKEVAWRNWFKVQSISPLTITYEALSASPFGVRDQILATLGLTCDETAAHEAPVAKLADETNHKWARRFRDDHPDLVSPDLSVAF